MNDDDARQIATWIIDTFPSGPKAYIWKGLLKELEAGTAKGAYRQLARTCEKAPTTGQFMAEYNRLIRTETGNHYRGPVWRGDEIGLDDYLDKLVLKAQHNPDAADELGNWERWLKRPIGGAA